MGYTTNGAITNFWPDDTDKKFYLEVSIGYSLADILELAQKKWPGVDPKWINICAEHIHTHCIYHGMYDASDYTNFIVVENTR